MTQPSARASESAVVVLSDRIATRVIDGRAIVVVVDTQKLHALNETGTFLLGAIGGRTVGELVDALVAECDVDRQQALDDTLTFVDELIELQAIHLEGP